MISFACVVAGSLVFVVLAVMVGWWWVGRVRSLLGFFGAIVVGSVAGIGWTYALVWALDQAGLLV